MRKLELAAALVVGVVMCSGRPAPVAAASTTRLKSVSVETTAKPVSRRCWLRNGQKHCRRSDGSMASGARGHRARGGDYYERDASKLPFGSQRWWTVKEGEGSTGRP